MEIDGASSILLPYFIIFATAIRHDIKINVNAILVVIGFILGNNIVLDPY